MISKNGNAAADEARGAPDIDLLASEVDRENNSASAPAQAAPIVVTIGGPAVAKGRPRFTRSGLAYSRAKTRKYEAHGRLAAQFAMGDQPPLNGPVCLTALVELPIPASWSKPRTAVSFVKNFGDRRWELDALDPTNLRACVEEQILECIIEPTAWERCKVVERAERESLRTVLAEWGQR